MKKQLARIAVCFLLSLAAAQTALAQGTVIPFLTAGIRHEPRASTKTIEEGKSLSFRIFSRSGIPGENQPVRLVYRMVECNDLPHCSANIGEVEFAPLTDTVASDYGLKFGGMGNHAECDDESGWCLTPIFGWQNQGGRFFDTTLHTTDDNKVGQHQRWHFCADIAGGLTIASGGFAISESCLVIDIREDDLLQKFIRRSGYSSGDYSQMHIEIYRDYAGAKSLILPSNPSDPVTEFYIDVVASGSASIVIDGNHTKNTTAAFKMSESERGSGSGPYTIACGAGAGWVEITHPDGTHDREQFCR